MIVIPADVVKAMGEHAVSGYPYEVCGLMIGAPGSDRIDRFVPCTNTAASAKVYTIDPKEHLEAELAAEKDGLEVLGVMHSHTHSEAYPSATDVAQAPDPGWHYLIVSLKSGAPEPRSFRIVNGEISEEEISVA
jgi:[CysO sulfur-carrier protein]-S-L-cysteine hydrolase